MRHSYIYGKKVNGNCVHGLGARLYPKPLFIIESFNFICRKIPEINHPGKKITITSIYPEKENLTFENFEKLLLHIHASSRKNCHFDFIINHNGEDVTFSFTAFNKPKKQIKQKS